MAATTAVVSTASTDTSTQTALQFAIVAALTSAIVGLICGVIIAAGSDTISLIGLNSMQWMMAVTACVVGVAITMFGYRLVPAIGDTEEMARIQALARRNYVERVIVAATYGTAGLIGTCVVFFVLEFAFFGASTQSWSAVGMTAIFGATFGFVMANTVTRFNETMMVSLGLVMAFGGILCAAIVCTERDWWRYSISDLGMNWRSAMIFNVSIALTGLILTAAAWNIRRFCRILRGENLIPSQFAYNALFVAMIVAGLGVTFVGLFPYDPRPIMHTVGSHGALVVFTLLMFASPTWLPFMPKMYSYASYFVGIISVAVLILYVIGAAAFTVAELMWFVLWGTWVYVIVEFMLAYFRSRPNAAGV